MAMIDGETCPHWRAGDASCGTAAAVAWGLRSEFFRSLLCGRADIGATQLVTLEKSRSINCITTPAPVGKCHSICTSQFKLFQTKATSPVLISI